MAQSKMEFRNFGPTGLKVSVLGFGNWLTSDKGESDQKRTTEMIRLAYEGGVRFFDTAEVYGMGKAEIAMGNAFKELNLPREQLVVSTKIYWGGQGPNDTGLSRKHVIEGMTNCLKRLQLDYVDVVFCHRPDINTPVEETCRAFDYLINNGKAFYWGTSEWTAERIAQAYAVCDRLGLHRPIVEQCQYSMLVRERFEKEYALLFKEHKMATTIWSPIAGGILSGKYNEKVPEGSRYDSDNPILSGIFSKYFSEENKEGTLKKLQAIGDIAKEVGCTQAQLALAWTLVSKNVSVCLFGATTPEQMADNLKAVEIYKNLTPEIEAKLDKVLGNKPEQEIDFRSRTPQKFDR